MKKYILYFFLAVFLIGGWWIYKLIWGKPLNITHFYERVFIEYLLDDPEMLTQLGMIDNTRMDFHSGKLTNASPVRTEKLAEKVERDLRTLRKYNRDRLEGQTALSYDILEWFLTSTADSRPFTYHNYPVNQLFGVQNSLPRFMATSHQLVNEKSVRNYISRLSLFGTKFEQVLQGLQLREERSIIPPEFVIDRVLTEMRAFTERDPRENILFTSFKERVDTLDAILNKDELYEQVADEIVNTVYPGYALFINYFEELKTKATDDDGVWKHPDGDAFYAHQLRLMTTTDLSPGEIHDIGLNEVTRIQNEMNDILASLGLRGRTFADNMRIITEDERYLYPNTEEGRAQALGEYQAIIDEIDESIDIAFDIRPTVGVRVERIPEFTEETAPGAYYQPPALDRSRPGVFYANLRDMTEVPKWGMRTLAYHEAIPGHHFQIAIQQEISGVSTFRRVLPFTAYTEGWALYAEQLAWEYGFQDEPLDNLGRLQAELFRAVRLVVDTGIHYKRWTREEAIEYMHKNTGMPMGDVVSEIERYIVMPGQATAYKIGMIKILELRERAQRELGDRFDIKQFHNVILQNGAMPLDILEEVVERYIAETRGM
jgi:uncharacterized protein (DUF885 family)